MTKGEETSHCLSQLGYKHVPATAGGLDGILWNVRPVVLYGVQRPKPHWPAWVLPGTREQFQNPEVLEGKAQELRSTQIHVKKNRAILFPFSIKK